MERNNQDGAYAIQEQGDLGLGTTEIDPKYVTENQKDKKRAVKLSDNIQIPKEESIGFDFR